MNLSRANPYYNFHFYSLFLIINLCLVNVGAPPVDMKPPESSTLSEEDAKEQEANGVEYEKYLKEVVEILESDPEFKKKIENATQDDIKSGKIADELDFVDMHLRTKLDEIKRRELDRIKKALEKQRDFDNGTGKNLFPGHLNDDETFEIEDLRKLVIEATKDLEEIDKKRKEDFKQYELNKKYEEKEKLDKLKGEELEKARLEAQRLKQKHAEHPKLNHPMSQDQLEEVWQDVDNMDKETLDLKTFFNMHDLDGNGLWDEGEIKALFQNELDKAYNESAPEDDMRERLEEMERMREHVMNETDKNRDRMISFDEFMNYTKSQDYSKNQGWDTMEKQNEPYSDEEFARFEAEMQKKHAETGAAPPAHTPPATLQVAPDLHPPASVDDNSVHSPRKVSK